MGEHSVQDHFRHAPKPSTSRSKIVARKENTMTRQFTITAIVAIAAVLFFAACTADGPDTTPDPPIPPPDDTTTQVDAETISEGGRLYDKWWVEAEVDQPEGDQPLWASQDTNTRSGSGTWRCKECHGWDYMGAEGAYASGSHFTGFAGVFGSPDLTAEEIIAWLNGTTNPEHDFSAMGDTALESLGWFLSDGLVDVSVYIDDETKAALGGDVSAGEALYTNNCAACHGVDGRTINFHDPDDPEYIGTIADGNPWEFIHKVRAGQPGTEMPSSIDNGWSLQGVINLLAYAQTLPTDPPAVSIGGRLYDKWWVEAEVDQPEGDQPLWASQDTNTRSGSGTWRCKECHGWDYMGAEGAYSSGSHFTGFVGVLDSQGLSSEELSAWLNGTQNADHDFSAMGDDALSYLVTFLSRGVVDTTPYIDPDTKAAIGGDASNGELLYAQACIACHGLDGTQINFGDADDPDFVGTIAVGNPWEFIHKVRAGQPGTMMPSAIDSGWTFQDIVDLLFYAQSLPVE
jgi:thiosulfate dehydrogenase